MTITDEPRLIQFPALTDAQTKLDAKRKEVADVLAEAGPNYDMAQVKSVPGTATDKVAWIAERNAEILDLKKDVDGKLVIARAAAEAKDNEDQGEKGSEPDSETTRTKDHKQRSVGELVVASDAIKGYRPGSGSGPTVKVDIELKTLFQTSAGWTPETTRTGRLEYLPTRPAPHVADFIPQTTTNQAAIVYMEETTFTNTAAETAEAGTYPEATLVLTERTSTVRKIPVFLPVTDEQFEDEPRSRDYVNNRLPFMIRQRLDLQALVGSGAGVNLMGTENVVGIQTQALGADPVPDAIYKAARKVRDDGFAEPSVVFITPANWEDVRLLRTADGQYIWGHPSMPGPFTIWGIPVVETTAAPATKALLGDYTNFSELAVRRGIDVQVSNSHSTFFVEGKLAIRADIRVALIHYRPKAFAAVTGL